ncbi:hypothetical protein IKT18_01785 [Candidatus Saccharibacteria bacterium]|nr:hypothetical protein [Candidatus Saccharibacteria bacterium]
MAASISGALTPLVEESAVAEPDNMVVAEDFPDEDATKAEDLPVLSKDETTIESRASVDLMIQAKKEEARIRRAEEDAKEYADLDWIKAHLDRYYTEEEIRQTTQIIMAEDLVAYSDTIWSAHAWVIVGRVGASGFANNDTIIGVLSAKNQFSTYTTANLSVEPDPRVEWIVRDVFARKVLEDMGAPEWEVGRTVPKTHLFFDNRDDNPYYNEFYRYCWGDIYDPFSSPYNPYDN